MTYKHGDWFCKPASEAEAREIIERALANGAAANETLEVWPWDMCEAWGVYNGYTYTQSLGFYRDRGFTEYTIEQVREKFPMPGEQQQWNGEGLPPVGVECEMKSGECRFYMCVILRG